MRNYNFAYLLSLFMEVLNIISSPEDLITSRVQTRAGFINFALEKNRLAKPYVDQAKSLKALASKAKEPTDLLKIREIRKALLTAAGLSDKALNYFSEDDKTDAIKKLIKDFLEPEGEYFIDALVYRFLLIKGDTLGGSMRNLVGAIAQQKLISTIISNLSIMGLDFSILNQSSKKWNQGNEQKIIESNVKAIHWKHENKDRIIAFNLRIPIVKKNVDICLFEARIEDYKAGKIVEKTNKCIMLGELKGGIDPAGADEHWKTGNTALDRIRDAFSDEHLPIKTSFIGAAIEFSMATEIYHQLKTHKLSYAANLTIEDQLVNYCDWLISL